MMSHFSVQHTKFSKIQLQILCYSIQTTQMHATTLASLCSMNRRPHRNVSQWFTMVVLMIHDIQGTWTWEHLVWGEIWALFDTKSVCTCTKPPPEPHWDQACSLSSIKTGAKAKTYSDLDNFTFGCPAFGPQIWLTWFGLLDWFQISIYWSHLSLLFFHPTQTVNLQLKSSIPFVNIKFIQFLFMTMQSVRIMN